MSNNQARPVQVIFVETKTSSPEPNRSEPELDMARANSIIRNFDTDISDKATSDLYFRLTSGTFPMFESSDIRSTQFEWAWAMNEVLGDVVLDNIEFKEYRSTQAASTEWMKLQTLMSEIQTSIVKHFHDNRPLDSDVSEQRLTNRAISNLTAMMRVMLMSEFNHYHLK